DARTLTFVPAEPLPRSTRFEVEVPAGSKAPDGFGLPKAVRWSFETERLRISFPARGAAQPEKWPAPDHPVTLPFNHPLPARDVEKRCAYVSDADRVPAIVDNTGESEEARQRFRVIPHAPLAHGTRWRFRCEAQLTGAEGPLGLETGGGADGGPPPGELAFET